MKTIRILIALLLLCGTARAANELQLNVGTTGATVYVVVWDSSGQAYNGSAYATYTTTRSTWDIAAAEIGTTGYYTATFPSTGTGQRRWSWFLDSDGGSPSHTDDVELAIGSAYWNGTTLGDAIAAASASAATVSAFLVDEDHTWIFASRSQTTSPQLVTELRGTDGFNGLVAMDFTVPMPANAVISSVGTVGVADEAGKTEPTLSTASISPDKKKIHIPVNATSATAGTYTISVTITTTDSQTFMRKGRLVLE